MAGTQEQLDFMSNLEIKLSVSGVKDTASALREISAVDKDILKDTESLKKKYGSLEKAVQQLVKAYKVRKRVASGANKKEQDSINELNAGFKGLTKTVKGYTSEIANAAKALVVPASLGETVKLTLEYNKALMSSSVGALRFGQGIAGLEKSLAGLARETKFTRMETVKLFDQYREGMKYAIKSDMEGMMKRLKSIFGANEAAVGAMAQKIYDLSDSYPELAKRMAGLDGLSGEALEKSKALSQSEVNRLAMMDKGIAKNRIMFSAYISGASTMTDADIKRAKEAQRLIDLSQKYKMQIEKIKIALGEAFLPVLTKVAGLL